MCRNNHGFPTTKSNTQDQSVIVSSHRERLKDPHVKWFDELHEPPTYFCHRP